MTVDPLNLLRLRVRVPTRLAGPMVLYIDLANLWMYGRMADG